MQVLADVPPQKLFSSSYRRFSSRSDTAVAHARSLANTLVDEHGLGPGSRVVEIGSNDGIFLRHLLATGVEVLGVDPAPGPTAVARRLGIPVVEDFFDAALGRQLADEGVRADVVVANQVLSRVSDVNGFLDGVTALLAPDGVLVVETPSLLDVLTQDSYSAFSHEEPLYLSGLALTALMARHGLQANGVEPLPGPELPVLRWHLSRRTGRGDSVDRWLTCERAHGLARLDTYRRFATAVERRAGELRRFLEQLRGEHKRLVAFGADTSGTTLLNVAGIGPSLLDYVVDADVAKQSLYMPGVHLAIRSPRLLLTDRPDYVLLASPGPARAIVPRQADYRAAGGAFIEAFPRPRIVA